MARNITINMQLSHIIAAALLLITAACSAPQASEKAASASQTVSFFITIPGDGTSLSHQGGMGLAMLPEGIPPLDTNSLSFTSQLRDSDREIIGIASELEDFSGAGEFREGAIWETYWTLAITGRGSLFLHEQEQLDPVFAGILMQTKQTGQDWIGTHNVETNYGPLPSGHGVVIGGTGEFEDATGTFQEIGSFTGLTADGVLSGEIELRVQLLNQ